MNLTRLKAEILTAGLSNSDLDELSETIRYARSQLGKIVRRQLQAGATVKFVSNRNGQTYLGTVEKVAIKNVVVRTAMGRYRVPANMLEVQ